MGETEGKPDGLIDVEGAFVGDRLGAAEGTLVGDKEGEGVGKDDGEILGTKLRLGLGEGAAD